jgi:hypothetical protein
MRLLPPLLYCAQSCTTSTGNALGATAGAGVNVPRLVSWVHGHTWQWPTPSMVKWGRG